MNAEWLELRDALIYLSERCADRAHCERTIAAAATSDEVQKRGRARQVWGPEHEITHSIRAGAKVDVWLGEIENPPALLMASMFDASNAGVRLRGERFFSVQIDRDALDQFACTYFKIPLPESVARDRAGQSVVMPAVLAAPASPLMSGGAENDPPRLRRASDAEIEAAISAAYDAAEKARDKAPNVKELPPLVKTALRAANLEATYERIERAADAKKFQARRRKPGLTVASERRQRTRED